MKVRDRLLQSNFGRNADLVQVNTIESNIEEEPAGACGNKDFRMTPFGEVGNEL